MADTLRFHMRDTSAAKDLLYRRLKTLAAFESANKELDLARSRNRDREAAELRQKDAWAVFEGVRNNFIAKTLENSTEKVMEDLSLFCFYYVANHSIITMGIVGRCVEA